VRNPGSSVSVMKSTAVPFLSWKRNSFVETQHSFTPSSVGWRSDENCRMIATYRGSWMHELQLDGILDSSLIPLARTNRIRAGPDQTLAMSCAVIGGLHQSTP